MDLKEILKNKMTKNELLLVPSSFDIIGSKEKAVAIIDIPESLKKKYKIIAEGLMEKHKNVKSVLLKASPRKGKYRIRKYKLIAGIKNTEVVHIENGCRFLIDPRKVYFSPREGTERIRIIEKIKPNETVMVFFAGVGPFAIEIAKKTKAKKIIGIEINPKAIKYFKKNIELNKINNVEAIFGDVKKEARKFYNSCDRVLMPLPEKAIEFLDDAVNCLKKNGVCHFYCFSKEEKLDEIKEKIRLLVKRKIMFIEVKKVLPYGPGVFKYRIDFKVF
ncbi:MAG: class I SAM-dependent methyltransferase family protein [Candidatus Aenigmatarchaeota archaeon]